MRHRQLTSTEPGLLLRQSSSLSKSFSKTHRQSARQRITLTTRLYRALLIIILLLLVIVQFFGANRAIRAYKTAFILPYRQTVAIKALTSQRDKAMINAGITPIRHIFQTGPPGTASTTQFNIVCVALFLHTLKNRPELVDNTICTPASHSMDDTDYMYLLQQPDIPQAVRSHVVDDIDPVQLHPATLVFATAKDRAQTNAIREQFQQKNLNVAIVQDMELLKTLGIEFWIKVYGEYFSLDVDDIRKMTEYFVIWGVLRQCCGMQMNKLYRNELLPPQDRNEAWDRHPTCGSENTDALESRFIDTPLYVLLEEYDTMRKMNRPSAVDGDLDGTYCARYEAAVRTHGIQPESAREFDGLNSRYEELENHWEEEMRHPLGPIDHLMDVKCDGDKFIFYTAGGSFVDQIGGLEAAMRIAYSTNRTVILPPLLQPPGAVEDTLAIESNNNPLFRGRDIMSEASSDTTYFIESVRESVSDFSAARSLSNRHEFPSWSEILNLKELSSRTGVKLIDLYDFINTKSHACMYDFYKQPFNPESIAGLTSKSEDSWAKFVDLFEEQYTNHFVALIGNVNMLNFGSNSFTSHEDLFGRYDAIAKERISEGVRSMPLSKKVNNLLQTIHDHLPKDYTAVYLKAGDETQPNVQNCKDKMVVNEYSKVKKRLQESKIAEGSTIYIASNDRMAKSCFDKITEKNYKLVHLDGNFVVGIEQNVQDMQTTSEQMEDILIDGATKQILLDILLASMGSSIYFLEDDQFSSIKDLITRVGESLKKKKYV